MLSRIYHVNEDIDAIVFRCSSDVSFSILCVCCGSIDPPPPTVVVWDQQIRSYDRTDVAIVRDFWKVNGNCTCVHYWYSSKIAASVEKMYTNMHSNHINIYIKQNKCINKTWKNMHAFSSVLLCHITTLHTWLLIIDKPMSPGWLPWNSMC